LGNYNSASLSWSGHRYRATVIVDDIVVAIEVGLVKLNRKECLMHRLSKDALKRDGREHWSETVLDGC
jgi:hypothetical protein